MSSLRCRINWHDWTKYGDPVKGYSGITQFRECKRCGSSDYRGTYSNQCNVDDIKECRDSGVNKDLINKDK